MKLPGYTLLEIGIALLLVGVLVAVAVPTLNALTGAELKRSTGMLQGLMRDTYARAALSGNAHRIVFDLDMNTYWVEQTEGNAVMPRKLYELTNEGGAVLDVEDERLEDVEKDSKELDDQTKRALLSAPRWAPVPAPSEKDIDDPKPQKLPSACDPDEVDGCVRFKKVWADHLADPAFAGQVAVTFFPGGYAQEAHVTVTDEEDGERVYTLELQPLTAEVYVHQDEPHIPEIER
jgi:type II secretory pathway pseudopilin PulG